jgi:hypothetical protein
MAEETRSAPYGAFETFKNATTSFAEGLPHRIDRSALPGLAWNATSRLISGFKFLELIDDSGAPQPALISLAAATDEAERKRLLEPVIRRAYAEAFALDLTRMTPSLLAETFRQHYNATGDTLEKAVRFFLAACVYLDIPISPLLSRERRRGIATSKPRKATAPKKPGTTGAADAMPVGPVTGPTRKINLESGGTITVIAAVDFLTLSAADRQFVFEVIDRLSAYERDNPVVPPDENGDED